MDVLMIGNVEKIVDSDVSYDEFVMPPESSAVILGEATFPGYLSLGMGIVATALTQAGHDVRCINDYHRFPNFRAYLQRHQPRYIAVSCTLLARRHIKQLSAALCADISATNLNCTLVLGGAKLKEMHPCELVELLDTYDYIITGEGEQTFNQLIAYLETDHYDQLNEVGGLVYKQPSGEPKFNHPAEPVNVVNLPLPSWSLFEDFATSVPVLPIQATRGCVAKCEFCFEGQLFAPTIRARPVEHVVAEIRQDLERYGVRHFVFVDSTFTSPRRYCEELLNQILRENLKMQWISYARVNDLTPELVRLMVDTGCLGLFLGIESGDDTVLKAMRKGYKVSQVIRGLTLLRQAGLFHHCNFIVGYPGETRETFRHTLALIRDQTPDTCAMYPLNITRGTALFDQFVFLDAPEMSESKNLVNFPEQVMTQYGFDLLEFALQNPTNFVSLISYDYVLLGHIAGWNVDRVREFFSALNDLFRHQVCNWVNSGQGSRFNKLREGQSTAEWLADKKHLFLTEEQLHVKETLIVDLLVALRALHMPANPSGSD